MNGRQREEELRSHLENQIRLLAESARRFDEGNAEAATSMTMRIRVLLHDTRFQTSLLTLLKKCDLLFYDTEGECHPDDREASKGRVRSKLPRRDAERKIPLERWWNQVVWVDPEGRGLTRKEIVLRVAHRDRGALGGLERDNAYGDRTRHRSSGIASSHGGGREPSPGPEEAAVRQIAYEVLKSLEDAGPDLGL
jgi:hypothetical protein